jgi:hypothetical protein
MVIGIIEAAAATGNPAISAGLAILAILAVAEASAVAPVHVGLPSDMARDVVAGVSYIVRLNAGMAHVAQADEGTAFITRRDLAEVEF